MKKGIIVEQKRRYTIVMDRTGMFHKAKKLHAHEVGEEVGYEILAGRYDVFFLFFKRHQMKFVTMVALCLLIFTPFYIWSEDEETFAIVSMDINPSINITIDQSFDVLEILPMNKDAIKIVNQLQLDNRTLPELSEEIIELARRDFQIEEDAPILMAVSYVGDNSNSEQTVVVTELESFFLKKSYDVAIYEVPDEIREQAEEEQVSLNAVAANELDENSPSFSKKGTESAEALPELDEEERELIYHFYHEEDTSNQEETTESDSVQNEGNTEPIMEEETTDESIPSEEDVSTLEPVETDEQIDQDIPPLPEQASDTARANRLKNKSSDNKEVHHQKNDVPSPPDKGPKAVNEEKHPNSGKKQKEKPEHPKNKDKHKDKDHHSSQNEKPSPHSINKSE
ncbi:hypothetical protein ACFOZ1_03020 [Gracilibacillus marinus]|uniref:RsgI N-terminal anti-sigma domain-containing protein n=1 Tax=Gracilibacillus marinus TaxID=630535 RepID=A0ABV8VS00_9BACI